MDYSMYDTAWHEVGLADDDDETGDDDDDDDVVDDDDNDTNTE